MGGKHRTEVTEATEGGIGIGGQKSSVNGLSSWAKNTLMGGKHRTEVTEATEGGLGLVAKNLR